MGERAAALARLAELALVCQSVSSARYTCPRFPVGNMCFPIGHRLASGLRLWGGKYVTICFGRRVACWWEGDGGLEAVGGGAKELFPEFDNGDQDHTLMYTPDASMFCGGGQVEYAVPEVLPYSFTFALCCPCGGGGG